MEEVTEGTEGTEGQVSMGPDGGQTTQAAPEGTDGQPDAGTTGRGTQEPTFFDPNQVPEELLPAYKSMQRAFSKKMETLSGHKQKVEAYDAFTQDPIGQMQRYAAQYGYRLTRAEAAQQLDQGDAQQWEPQSWDDVLDRAKDLAKQELIKEFNPVLREVQAIKKNSIERELSEIDPMWRRYEDDMKVLMNKHPSLSSDASLLYKMAVPEDVLQSRATQRALAKLEAKGKSAQVSGVSTTNKQPPDKPEGKMTFDEAVQYAKRKLAEEGITGGG